MLKAEEVKFEDRTPGIEIYSVVGRSNYRFYQTEHILAANELQAINALTKRVMVCNDVKDAASDHGSTHAICIPYSLVASYDLIEIVET